MCSISQVLSIKERVFHQFYSYKIEYEFVHYVVPLTVNLCVCVKKNHHRLAELFFVSYISIGMTTMVTLFSTMKQQHLVTYTSRIAEAQTSQTNAAPSQSLINHNNMPWYTSILVKKYVFD